MRPLDPRRRGVRLSAGAGLALALVVGQGPAAQAHGSRDSVASFDDQRIVELTTHGSRGRAGLAFHQTRAQDVTATNAAVAYTSCDGCRAVALSFQVVVADGGPETIDAGNLAFAMNENCTGCESVAVAFQVVLASDKRLVLSKDGRHELEDLRRQLRSLSRSDLPVTEIQTTAEAMMAQVANVLASELKVRAKVRCNHDVERRPWGDKDQRHHDGRGDNGDQTDQSQGGDPET